MKKIKDLVQNMKCCCQVPPEPEPTPEPEPVPVVQDLGDSISVEDVPLNDPVPVPAVIEPVVSEPKYRKALLLGLNYLGTTGELGGCINDVKNIKKMLLEKYNYDEVLMVTDEGQEHFKDGVYHKHSSKPTKENILTFLDWLTKDSNKNSQLYFHYSGHGSYVTDDNDDELDGKDECLVPLDYTKSGFIRDDLFKSSLIKNLHKDANVTMVVDACHSGTMLDLKYKIDCTSVTQNKNTKYVFDDWTSAFNMSQNSKYSNDLNIFTISGCRDTQTSADAWINNKYQGALSYNFMKALELNNYDVKIKYLLKDIHCLLKIGTYNQKPVISSSNSINIEDKFML